MKKLEAVEEKIARKSVGKLNGLSKEEFKTKVQEAYPELASIMDLELLNQPITPEYVQKLRQAERKPSK